MSIQTAIMEDLNLSLWEVSISRFPHWDLYRILCSHYFFFYFFEYKEFGVLNVWFFGDDWHWCNALGSNKWPGYWFSWLRSKIWRFKTHMKMVRGETQIMDVHWNISFSLLAVISVMVFYLRFFDKLSFVYSFWKWDDI